MADAAKPLSLAEIEKFLAIKKVSKSCPTCGHNSINYQDEAANNARSSDILFKFPGWEIGEAATLDKVIINCENCGHLRYFLREKLIESLK